MLVDLNTDMVKDANADCELSEESRVFMTKHAHLKYHIHNSIYFCLTCKFHLHHQINLEKVNKVINLQWHKKYI